MLQLSAAVHLSLVLLWFTLPIHEAFIPAPCAKNITKSKMCCLVPNGHHHVCGGPIRGHCERVEVFADPVRKAFEHDDRLHWPIRLFEYVCICKPNFWGPGCEQCWFGWEGPNCDKKSKLRVRKNYLKYSAKEKELFHKVLMKSYHEPTDYVVLVEPGGENWRYDPIRKPLFEKATVQYLMSYIHRYATRGTLINNPHMCPDDDFLDFGHSGSGFSLWHRMMMLVWQRFLEDIAKKYFDVHDFTLPYWNWVDEEHCSICRNDMVGEEGHFDRYGQRLSRDSPFYNWNSYCTEIVGEGLCFGCHVLGGPPPKVTREWTNPILPTTDDLDFVMKHHQFFSDEEDQSSTAESPCLSFQRALEGFCGPEGTDPGLLYFHNRVHTSINGSMLFRGSTANDPLFIPSHVEVDRLLQAWFIDHKPSKNDFPKIGDRPGHCRDCHIVPFLSPVPYGELFVRAEELGYTYDCYKFGKEGRVYGTGEPKNYYDNDRSKRTCYPPLGTVPPELRRRYE